MPDFCDCGVELVALSYECPDFGGTVEIAEEYCIECAAVVG
mgnify:CR=1 FL=1|jgi:hypothetical protein